MVDNPDTPEPEDLIRYDILAQDAMRGLVRKVLTEIAQIGELPGEHHFYITFDTNAPGVKLSTRMKEKYPDEMTIVVQHQFWDLKTTEAQFSIGLSFNDIPETLVIPFAAISGFFDPSVQFGLQFDTTSPELVESEPTSLSVLPSAGEVSTSPLAEALVEAVETEEDEAETAEVVSLDAFRKK